MKSAVVYYSYSGNTRKVAKTLLGLLAKNGEAREIELVALDESGNFFKQCLRARKHVRAKIDNSELDLSGYGLICFGTPVWAFAPVPAMNTYLDNCKGVAGKKIILFTTYGSGTGNKNCLDYIQKFLSEKDITEFKRFSIQQLKVNDQDFVPIEIKKIL